MTYRISEKERIKQRRAARLQVADRRADGLATSEVLEIYLPFTHNRTLPKRRGDASKRLAYPPPPVRERNTDPLSLWERVRVRAPGRTPLPPRGRPQPDA